MIRGWSIRRRILAIALLPPILVGLLLGGFFTVNRIADLRSTQQGLGQTIVNQLAPASEYGLFTRDRATLQNLVQAVLAESGVDAVAIRDAAGETLAAAARTPSSQPPGWWQGLVSLMPVSSELLVFSAPVLVDAAPLDELAVAPAAPRQLGQVVVTLSQRRLAERQFQVLATGALLTLGLLALSAVIALLFARSLDAPLRRVTQAVRRFRDGRLEARVPELSGGELGELERGLNSMADALGQSRQHLQEQVEQATDELRQTLEAVEIKNVELDLARKRALTASRVKSEFLANISHEIRTPMNAIVGYTRLLARTDLDGDQRDYVGIIERSSRSLLDLLEDVLNLSRIEAGKAVLDVAEFDVLEIVDHLLTLHAPAAYAKALELVLDADLTSPAAVVGDAGKLQQVLNNLLHNAIKFTAQGSITLHLAHGVGPEGRPALSVTVADTGRGIPPEARAMLFTAFSQLDTSDQRREGGMGLGLAISRKLVEAMGGTLELHDAPGGGSAFRVSVPMAPAGPQRTPDVRLSTRTCVLHVATPGLAGALARRLGRWFSSVEPADSVDDALGRVTRQRDTVLVLGLEPDDAATLALLADQRAALDGAAILLLVRSAEREVQRSIARRLGLPCLPRYTGDAALRAELQRLLASGARPPPSAPPDLGRVLARLDAEVLAMLRSDLPAQQAGLHAALAAGSLEGVTDLAHQVHGTAAFCHLLGLEHASDALERCARAGRRPDAGLVAAFDAELAAALAAASRPLPSAPERDTGARLQGLRVLVADDNRINRELLQRILSLQGAEVTVADDAPAALLALEHAPCDVALFDLHMPGMSGLEAARLLRARPAPLGELPLVACTANALPETRLAAEAAGFDAYLVKPVEESELLDALTRVVTARVTRSA
jgi:two-component system sensor histidine kinase BarA